MQVLDSGSSGRGSGVLPAITSWQVEKRWANRSLIRIWSVTGVRHQIRAHMAYLGCPILGDKTYGDVQAQNRGTGDVKRLMLHAHELVFVEPGKEGRTRIVSKMPEWSVDKDTHFSDISQASCAAP